MGVTHMGQWANRKVNTHIISLILQITQISLLYRSTNIWAKQFVTKVLINKHLLKQDLIVPVTYKEVQLLVYKLFIELTFSTLIFRSLCLDIVLYFQSTYRVRVKKNVVTFPDNSDLLFSTFHVLFKFGESKQQKIKINCDMQNFESTFPQSDYRLSEQSKIIHLVKSDPLLFANIVLYVLRMFSFKAFFSSLLYHQKYNLNDG